MTFSFKASLATASLALTVALAMPAAAADLNNGGNWGRGSIKDYAPATQAAPVGPCYFRADTGYSLSNDPNLSWNAVDSNNNINQTVSNTSRDNNWLVEAGVGCGSGSRGLRADFTLGYHGNQNVSGTTASFNDGAGNNINSHIVSSIQTYTAMANFYYDLGNMRGFVPYVGAGVGLAYHRVGDYSLPDWTNSNPPNYAVHGANDVSLAWSLMAGVGYQISDRAILDLGYRYIDLGTAETARNDNGGGAQLSRLTMNDLTAHEFKIGLRYHFGAGGDCCSATPLK